MKKLSLALAFFLISINASAASSAGASLSNFQFDIISGENVIPFLDTLSIDINNNVSDQFLTHTYDHVHSVGWPFSLNLRTSDGSSISTGRASGSTQLQSLSANASTAGGDAVADVSGNMQFSYKAFTLLSFSADAAVYGSADKTNGIDSANSFVQILLSSLGFDGAFSSIRVSADLNSGSGLSESGEYSSTKRIKFFFYDDKDSYIQLHALVNASASAMPVVTSVPEPETYALMLLGLGFVGFSTKQRKVTQN